MVWEYCTSGAAITKAGASANSTIVASGAALERWYNEAHSFINNTVAMDLSGASITNAGKQVLQRMASAMIAQNIVAYDISSYVSSRMAETTLDKLEDEISKCTAQLQDKDVRAFLGITAA